MGEAHDHALRACMTVLIHIIINLKIIDFIILFLNFIKTIIKNTITLFVTFFKNLLCYLIMLGLGILIIPLNVITIFNYVSKLLIDFIMFFVNIVFDILNYLISFFILLINMLKSIFW